MALTHVGGYKTGRQLLAVWAILLLLILYILSVGAQGRGRVCLGVRDCHSATTRIKSGDFE